MCMGVLLTETARIEEQLVKVREGVYIFIVYPFGAGIIFFILAHPVLKM